MGRVKGSKNKIIEIDPLNTTMSLEERIAFLADLIAQRIMSDQDDDAVHSSKVESCA